jgi:hypothetical protein
MRDNAMKMHMIRTFFAAGLAGGVFNAAAVAQTADTVEAHVAAAKAAAGDRHDYIFDSLCMRPSAGPNTGGDEIESFLHRHTRACRGHPRLSCGSSASKT